ncbi:hypothetical protein D3C84_997270 [compost metagenome]
MNPLQGVSVLLEALGLFLISRLEAGDNNASNGVWAEAFTVQFCSDEPEVLLQLRPLGDDLGNSATKVVGGGVDTAVRLAHELGARAFDLDKGQVVCCCRSHQEIAV